MTKTYLHTLNTASHEVSSKNVNWGENRSQCNVSDVHQRGLFANLSPARTPVSASSVLAPLPSGAGQLAVPAKEYVSLSSLLNGVSRAVAQAYQSGIWTMIEVVELRAHGGNIYLSVSERDSNGVILAKANATIWKSTANDILAKFERATGVQLAPGIKLLVRARPVFKPSHGFSLAIDAIDSEYTLGDLQARMRAIREQLIQEGVFEANKNLRRPWDFNAVLVVAPEGGAGLGDFQAEANRLEKFGVCRFTYVYSRFQGEGAAREICDTLNTAIEKWRRSYDTLPDAVVIIRGGGAVNDMAWLNDYDLARLVCDMPVPVLTGIGHERDSTIIDEVAFTKFDTPSKVIAGIEKVIFQRAGYAKAAFEDINHRVTTAIQSVRSQAQALEMTVTRQAHRHLAQGKQSSAERLSSIQMGAMQGIRSASEHVLKGLQYVKTASVAQLSDAKRNAPALWSQITLHAKHSVSTAGVKSDTSMGHVLERAKHSASNAMQQAHESLENVSTAAESRLRDGALRSEALMREIAGQGPEKTLSRGFALVRNQQGSPLTRAGQTLDGALVEIQFQDGRILATTEKHI